MRTIFTTLRGLFFMSCFALLWYWVALTVRPLDRGFSLPAWTRIPGVVIMLLGGALALTCVTLFSVRGHGTPAIFDAPTQFVAVGPYKHVRNPMYIGAWIVLIGFGLYQRSHSILLMSLVWLLLFHPFVVGYEEPNLRRRFGASYEEYLKTVPRWIPRW